MLIFGGTSFLIWYSGLVPLGILPYFYFFDGFALLIYILLYLGVFGHEEVKWMFINAGLGILGIYTQLDAVLSHFGKRVDQYPLHIHITPTLYFILYTFTIRQAVLDLFNAREDDIIRTIVKYGYITVSTLAYLVI